ncbi:unnamed protein product [Ixodes persulcatus]
MVICLQFVICLVNCCGRTAMQRVLFRRLFSVYFFYLKIYLLLIWHCKVILSPVVKRNNKNSAAVSFYGKLSKRKGSVKCILPFLHIVYGNVVVCIWCTYIYIVHTLNGAFFFIS